MFFIQKTNMTDTNNTQLLIPTNLKSEAQLHVQKLQQEMRNANIDALLVASNPNIYYLTLRFFRGYIWVPAIGDPLYLIIRPNNLTGENVAPIRKPEQLTEILESRGFAIPQNIGLEYAEISYSEVMRLKNSLGDANIVDATGVLKKSRTVKTDWEIEQMRIDASLQKEAYSKIENIYRPGITDIELQIGIEIELRKHGCLGYPRVSGRLMQINMGSVISGDNADVPTPYDFSMGGAGTHPSLPVGADGRELKNGTAVMVDMNGCFNGYQTDMTRTYRIGEVSELAKKAHNCSLNILHSLEKMAKPGVKICDLYAEAVKIADDAGLSDFFMGHTQKVAFIGHGVGIELNELPVIMGRSRETLEKGMVLAIEPKFVIPNIGALGAENTYVVTENGLENLTTFPEELMALE